MKDYSKYFALPDLKKAAQRTPKEIEIIRDNLVIPLRLSEIAPGKTYHVLTFGCQANERDGETIAGILEAIGYKYEANKNKADVVILNTCAVRENAEDRVFGNIGNLKQIKINNPEFIYGISGCMVQQESIVQEILQKHQQVDIIFGTHNINNLPSLLEEAYFSKEKAVEVYSKEGEVIENLPSKRASKIKAWVNIMYGCDKFCTYCIVPYTRGKERSRLMEDVLNEVQQLFKEGYQEITLLGQNVNAYGHDLKKGYDFGDLLNEVAKIPVPRIRFMTSHPWNFTNKMIQAIKHNPNVMPYIHLPIQSGDDEILRKMARRYTSEEYKSLYDKMKKEIPNVNITTDIIVGFPNENEVQFQHTIDIFNYCQFDGAFTFIYSPRPGTPAAKIVDNVSPETKHQRFNELLKYVDKYSLASNQACVGKVLEVLVDGPSKRNKSILAGYSETNKLVNFKGRLDQVGKIVKVKITNAKSHTLEGEAIE